MDDTTFVIILVGCIGLAFGFWVLHQADKDIKEIEKYNKEHS